MSNFDKYYELRKVDAHMHYNTNRPALLEIAKDYNFRYISFNTDIYFFPSVTDQEKIVLHQRETFGNRLDYLCTFSGNGFDQKDWAKKATESIARSMVNGSVGVKIWKNLGMELKDKSGKLVMVDDPRLSPIFEFLVKNKIPLTGHLGEPKNCWLPLENMTVDQDRKYFAEHPEYHMYLHPEFPSYEQQIQARDNVLRKHPDLIFCGAHFASLEWSVDEIAKRLDAFPHMMVDTAERICHIQHQSVTDYEKARKFVLKYHDRIMYSTDVIDDGKLSCQELKQHITSIWDRHWKYFTTDEMQTAPKVNGAFKGLNLPWEAIENIYYKNAERFYKLHDIKQPAKMSR
ncbi:MAG TPA: amidohydrolase family protein [Cytophagaceae bacterium]|nr:amidohydrolase family protein [Cytophagaceae bacterium]